MTFKSQTCVGRLTGRPLTEYDSEAEALQAASGQARRLVPYRCQTCGQWHLAPAERHTPSVPCPVCIGADGAPKAAYASERAARRRAAILGREQDARLRVYPCEHGQGWHLTSGSGR